MKLRYIFMVLLPCQVYAQSFIEKELNTSIAQVTVFLQGAQVVRTGEMQLTHGNTSVLLKNLSPYLDEKSIQVQGTGDFTMLSVHHHFNYLNELKKSRMLDSLQSQIDELEEAIALDNARLAVLAEKESVLNANKKLGGELSGPTIAQLQEAVDFYFDELTEVKTSALRIKKSITELTIHKEQLEKQRTALHDQDELPTSEIEIRVKADQPAKASISVSYLVANAGWFPKYDVRVKDVASPISLHYKADVFQHTGEDWENVQLVFSNADPNQSGVAPQLNTWYLNFARHTLFQSAIYGASVPGTIRQVQGTVVDENGETLPGVNILVKGTTVGTVTDVDGNYTLTLPNNASTLVFSFIGYMTQELPISSSLINVTLTADIQQLSEVVVMGYGLQGSTAGVSVKDAAAAKPITTTFAENQTSFEFAVDIPYTIKSDGEKYLIDLQQYDIPALYEYYAVPKIDNDAFLIARIIQWDQYGLLTGEANLYFEDAYVGRSVLDTKMLSDTLDISLGRDKSILISRNKVEQYAKKQTIGSNRVDTRGFEISVRNKKSQPVHLTILDQIPIPAIHDIQIHPVTLSGGTLDDKTGQLQWVLALEPQEQRKLLMQYEVKYPKREKVVLE